MGARFASRTTVRKAVVVAGLMLGALALSAGTAAASSPPAPAAATTADAGTLVNGWQ